MNGFLKQSTAINVRLGPFVDAAVGDVVEAGLAIAQADIRLSKAGGVFAQTHNAAGAPYEEHGYYVVPLDTTDTGTVGMLIVAVDEAGARPVRNDYCVLPANVFDSLMGTDYLDINVVQHLGAAAAPRAGDAFTRIGAPVGASISADIVALPTDADVLAQAASALTTYTVPTLAQMNAAHALLATAASMVAPLATLVKLLTAIELDGAVWRLTANALENVSPAIMAGTSTYTDTVLIGAVPIPDAIVSLYSDLACHILVATGISDALGAVTVRVNPGTYYRCTTKTPYSFPQPVVVVVV